MSLTPILAHKSGTSDGRSVAVKATNLETHVSDVWVNIIEVLKVADTLDECSVWLTAWQTTKLQQISDEIHRGIEGIEPHHTKQFPGAQEKPTFGPTLSEVN